VTKTRAPETLGDGVKGLALRLPAHLRGMDLSKVEIPEGETQEDLRERRARQDAGRRLAWARRLPKRYSNARLADVKPDQDPDHKVSRWLTTDHLTLLLTGEAGLGKTHCAYAIGHAAVDRGMWAVAWTMADLNAALRPGGDEAAYAEVTECDLLLLDDLGREKITDWTLEVLQRVLDHRNRERKRTIVTTNLGYDRTTTALMAPGLLERYGDPIVSRLMDDAVIAKVAGTPMRPRAAW
jgi:DNA replication protein DnaC